MDSSRHARIQDLFARALELPAEKRAGFLAVTCWDDDGVRAEVEELLATPSGGVDDHPREPDPPAANEGPSEEPGAVLGRYTLVEKIGEGGMGTVWRAEQEEPVRRQVALKIIRLGMNTEEVIVRFEAERQALALMDHPHIAKVFDGGTTQHGRPFFVMELVAGRPITEFCDEHRLTLVQRLELFARVCQAIQHAHVKGVIHRDIKPSNVLVALQDGDPVPRVIDFGIAKATSAELTQKTMLTMHDGIVGTPEYMAPEQADPMELGVDTRADVYSLGVVLYELLTGTTPFDVQTAFESGYLEFLRQIREVDPAKPSTRVSSLGEEALAIAEARHASVQALGTRLRGELDWIVMKALEKERERRYESAGSLAADMDRYLRDEPIEAAPPSRAYLVRKFVRRNRLAVGAALVVTLTLAGSTGALAWLFARSVEAEENARREAATASEALGFMIDMFEVSDPSQARGETVTAREILDRGAERIDRELADQPEIRSRLMASMGSVYLGLGLYDRAEDLVTAAAAERADLLGDEHPETLQSNSALGLILVERSQFDRAEILLRETVEKQRRVLGGEHPETLSSLLTWSRALQELSRFDETERVAREAYDGAQRSLGDDHELTRLAAGRLGFVHQEAGRFAEAEEYLLRTLDGQRRAHGDDHPETLTALNNVARLYEAIGRFGAAEELYLEAQETVRRVFGEEHLNFLKYRANIAHVYWKQQRHQEAEAIYREVLTGFRATVGDEHLQTLLTTNTLGVVLSEQGKHGEAESYYLDALDGLAKKLGDRNEHTLTSLSNLSMLYLNTGRLEEAEGFARDAYDRSVELQGEDHPDTLLRLENLGNVLYRRGDKSTVARLLDEVLEGRRRAFGNEHPAVTRTLVNVSIVRGGLGDTERATEVREELLERTRGGIETDYASVADELQKLARTRRLAGDDEGAFECLVEVLRIQLKALPSGSFQPLVAMRDLIAAGPLVGRWDEIEPRCEEFLEAHVQALGDDHSDTLLCVELIAAAYEQAGDAAQTEAWRTRLQGSSE